MGLTRVLEPTKGLLQACPIERNLQLDSDRVVPFLALNTSGASKCSVLAQSWPY